VVRTPAATEPAVLDEALCLPRRDLHDRAAGERFAGRAAACGPASDFGTITRLGQLQDEGVEHRDPTGIGERGRAR
jgi:hypothetical protein